MDFDCSNKKDVANAKKYIDEHLSTGVLANYSSILNKAIDSAWYITE